jgi:hypothetical protein
MTGHSASLNRRRGGTRKRWTWRRETLPRLGEVDLSIALSIANGRWPEVKTQLSGRRDLLRAALAFVDQALAMREEGRAAA